MESKESNLISIGGLWVNESKAGKKYMSGTLFYGTKILIFKNENKKTDKDPDYFMNIAQMEKREEKTEQPKQSGNSFL